MVNNILIEVLGSIAENERIKIRQRQHEGIEVARGKGVRFGRPKLEKPENWDVVIGRMKAGEITGVEAMKILGMKKTSFYKLRKLYS